MTASSDSSSGGIGLAGLLFVVFLVLKLTHVIDWSWWWVTAPLWISAVFGVAVFGSAVLGVVALLVAAANR